MNRNDEKRVFGNVKVIGSWLMLCVLVFLVSIFVHECGHGFANSLRGVECSTGFNRVGDIYKYPKDADFRAEYSSLSDSLLDFGVPATLLLAVVGTIIFCKGTGKRRKVALAVAATNSLMRLIPCLYVVLVPLLTGKVHNEDEYGTGLVLAEVTGVSWLTYVPALFSILVSVICIAFLCKKLKKDMPFGQIISYGGITLLSFYITMIIANNLDNLIRINWSSIH